MIPQIQFWFARAKGWARTITPNPAEEHNRIVSMEDFAERCKSDKSLVPELIDCLIANQFDRYAASRRLLELSMTDGPPSQRPPLPMYIDIVRAIHSILVEIGTDAVDALLQAYQVVNTEAPERLWILEVLADIGDPDTQFLFDSL